MDKHCFIPEQIWCSVSELVICQFLEVPDRFSDHGSELQIRGGVQDNSNIFFLISQ